MNYTLRNISAFFIAIGFILSGRVRKSINDAMKGDYILSIYFHNPSRKEFAFAVRWLKKKGFSFISMAELKEIIIGKRSFPKGAVFISADDGWASNVPNMVEVAHKEQIPITIFIATEAIENGKFWFSYARRAQKENIGSHSLPAMKMLPNHERLSVLSYIKRHVTLPREAMTVTELKLIDASTWVTIGAHSHSHPILVQCTEEELIHEITHSKVKLENWLQKEVDTFAYPNGDFSQREIDALKLAGYSLGFANSPEFLTRSALLQPYRIPRSGFLEGASKAENICRMVCVWKDLKKLTRKIKLIKGA